MSGRSRRLKEFDLDAPTMSREDRHRFRLATRFVTSNVARHFVPFSNEAGAWKVLVEVVPAITEPRTLDLLGVQVKQVVGDPAAYLAAATDARPAMALAWLEAGARSVFDEFGWPVAPFDAAVGQVIALQFVNVLVLKAKAWNKPRTMRAEIVVEVDDTEARIVAVFRSKDGGQVSRALLCRRMPSEFIYVPCLGKVDWLDDERLRLTSRLGDESWIAVAQARA